MINTKKLTREFEAAGINVAGCNVDGVVWDVDGETEIQNRPDVSSIIAIHDPIDYIDIRKRGSKSEFEKAVVMNNSNQDQAVEWIENNVNDFESAKQALKYIVRMVVSLRDYIWPGMIEK